MSDYHDDRFLAGDCDLFTIEDVTIVHPGVDIKSMSVFREKYNHIFDIR